MPTVAIFSYDPVEHVVAEDIIVKQQTSRRQAASSESLKRRVSKKWMEKYRDWNHFGGSPPIFESVEELRSFNAQGKTLVEELRSELGETAVVEPFLPLFINLEVGNAVSGWWHLRDRNYDMVIPIQRLPVSADLKSRLQAWRMRKHAGWLDPDCCASLNEEGHDLEEHILWELNVCCVDIDERAIKGSRTCSDTEASEDDILDALDIMGPVHC